MAMDLKQQLSDIIKNAANLTVITAVGDAQLGGTIENPTAVLPAGSKSLVTNMNILTGDITSVYSESLAADPNGAIGKVHDAMIARANDTIERNVALIRQLIEKFGNVL